MLKCLERLIAVLEWQALLDLLDQVDDAVKGSMLVQSKLSFVRKGVSTVEANGGSGAGGSGAAAPVATGKEEKVHCETILRPPPQPVPTVFTEPACGFVPSVGQAPQEEQNSSFKDPGHDNTEALSKVKNLDIGRASNDLVQLNPPVPDVTSPENVDNGLVTPNRMSCNPASEVSRNLASIQFLVLEVGGGILSKFTSHKI